MTYCISKRKTFDAMHDAKLLMCVDLFQDIKEARLGSTSRPDQVFELCRTHFIGNAV